MPVEVLAMPEEEEEKKQKTHCAADVYSFEHLLDGEVAFFTEDGVVTDTIRNIRAKQTLRQTVTRSLGGIREATLSKLARVLSDPKNSVKLNEEIWFSLLPKAPELCYLSLSGKFNRKHGYTIRSSHAVLPIDSAFRVIPPDKHIPHAYPYTVYDGKIIGYSPVFATTLVRTMIKAAVQEGREFYDGLSVSHYSSLPLSGSILSGLCFGPPGGNQFCYMICSIMKRDGINSALFMERTKLDYNIYCNLQNNPNYKPSQATAKAILFALRPTLMDAVYLYELAGYKFQQTDEDRLLLAFFANEDYDIDKYNEVIKSKGCTPLGSKPYKSKAAPKTK